MILHFKLLLRNCSRTLQSSPIQVRNFASRSQILCINGCRSQFLRSFSTDVNLINQTHEGDSSSLLKQYLAIKKGYKDYIMFFRVGDFYEFFFQDAIKVSGILNIALTSRGKYKGNDVPMCGIPYFNVDPYLKKVIKSGHKVVICEQLETRDEMKERQKKQGGVTVMKRQVTRIITAGTITEDQYLIPQKSNLLASLYSINQDTFALSCADISTGDFYTKEFPSSKLSEILMTYDPKELLLPLSIYNNPPPIIDFIKKQRGGEDSVANTDSNQSAGSESSSTGTKDQPAESSPQNYNSEICVLVPQSDNSWTDTNYEQYIQTFFPTSSPQMLSHLQKCSVCSLLSYVKTTQMGSIPCFKYYEDKGSQEIEIDQFTRESLDILKTKNGKKTGSLLDTIDYTVSPGGSRLLSNYLSFPSTNIQLINNRLDSVTFYKGHPTLQKSLRKELSEINDVDRALQRIILYRGNPRDLGMIRDFLKRADQIVHIFSKNGDTEYSTVIKTFVEDYRHLYQNTCQPLKDLLESMLSDDILPSMVSQGNFIKKGYDPELDELRSLHESIQDTISSLEKKYIDQTGIQKLSILCTQKGEYFISVPTSRSSLIKEFNQKNVNQFYLCKSLKSSDRYKTLELNEIETKYNNSAYLIGKKENELFKKICASIIQISLSLKDLSILLSQLDIYTTFSFIANKYHLERPIVNDSSSLNITEGRHLTIETNLKKQSPPRPYIHNDTHLSSSSEGNGSSMYLLTGPNMGGKSTYIRQIAQICILAQIGCYVPASYAEIGVVDKIYTRIGSNDDIYTNKSTFFLEMIETANILNTATNKSLVLVDEIGRGTGAQEGLSLSLSVLFYIYSHLKCRCIFATHFHELPTLLKNIPSISQYTMQAITTEKDIFMTYKLIPGYVKQSHAFQVAHMAGLPNAVIEQAQHFYNLLSKENHEYKELSNAIDSLYSTKKKQTPIITPKSQPSSQIQQLLDSIDINKITPLDAFNYIQQLKSLSKKTQ